MDLDGTIIDFADRPEDARPGPALLELLRDLAAQPGLSVAVASGRPRESLESLFVEAPGVWLVAEHGAWLRGEGAWRSTVPAELETLDALAAELEEVAAKYRKAWVERKTWTVCLHYRNVRPGERLGLLVQANAAFEARAGARRGYEPLEGADTFEVRPAGIRKSVGIPWIREKAGPGARLMALGDDVTDEDMFRALGSGDDAIKVGGDVTRPTAARWTLPEPAATVAFLRWILEARRESRTPPPEVLPAAAEARKAAIRG